MIIVGSVILINSGRWAANILPSTRLHLPQSEKWQIHNMYCGFRAPGTGKGTHQTCSLIPNFASVVSNPTEILERASQRAAKDISLKLETQVCTTKAEIPPRKPDFPKATKLRFGRWGVCELQILIISIVKEYFI